MICWKLDSQLQRLANDSNCTYTRYADDITFSFNTRKSNLPQTIVKVDGDDISVGHSLYKIITDNGFSINEEKVRLQGRNQRQEVTGITVNQRINIKRSFIRKTGSMLHAWKKYGVIAAEKEYISKYRIKELTPWQEKKVLNSKGNFFKSVVIGRINYIQMVRGRNDDVYRKLAYRLTEALGKPNEDFKRPTEELATFVIDNDIALCQGSGFLLEDIGIVTNHHVADYIEHNNDELITFSRYYEFATKRKASFICSSKTKDIAIFKPSNDFDRFPSLKKGDSSKIKIGDKIKVVGFPEFSDGHLPYINNGTIVSKRINFENIVWIVDIPINHGCSGAPIFNDKFKVIGIATFGAAKNDGSTDYNGFIPISTLTDFITSQ
ncbi:MAG: trypsin-like peptidase domain-containing protein [Cellvibrionaceae bacterium]